MVRVDAVEYHHFLAIQAVVIAICGRGGFDVGQFKTALAFQVGECAQATAINNLWYMGGLLLGTTTLLQQAAKQQHCCQVGLQHQTFAQLFHHQHDINGVATETTVLFCKGNGQPTQFCEGLPVSTAHPLL